MTERKFNTLRRGCSTLAISLALMMATATLGFAETKPISFNIGPKNTAQALIEFSKQAGIQILFPYAVAAKFEAPMLKGEYTTEIALAKLIDGTNLEIASVSDKAISLKVSEKSASVSQGGEKVSGEVVVTGTHIRGGNPTAPLRTITSKEIQQSGYAEVGDLIRSLPENFSGGQNPGVINGASANSGNNNVSNASSVNLRGLGTDATLVLVNGHRLAADGFYQGSDISGIPLSAVQRIEVVADGASALYGSDAVAGVVNFIMRRDYSGGEAMVRAGGATQGGGFSRAASMQAGTSTDKAYLLANIEMSDQDAVTAADRKFTANTPPEFSLLGVETRKSAFIAAGIGDADGLRLGVDALLSQRSSDLSLVYPPDVYNNHYYTPAYNFAATLDLPLTGGWNMRAVAVVGGSKNMSLTTSPSYPTYASLYVYRNRAQYAEAVFSGTAFALPSGPVKTAFGGGFRTEAFKQSAPGNGNTFKGDRKISYAFAEAQVPLVTPSLERSWLNELELNLSGRAEEYDGFGSTFNPKVGLRYVPFVDVSLRASWGKSFKAPTFYQLYSSRSIFLLREASVGGSGSGTALFLRGSNPDLAPETSTSWSLGMDFAPKTSTLKLGLTAFAIDYRDRVVLTVPNLGAALSDPIYAAFIDRSPSAGDQAALIASADNFYNSSQGPYDPTKVAAVINDVYANASAQTVRGLDLSYRQSFQLGPNSLAPLLNVTWLQLRQQTIPTVPMGTLTGTIFNPPRFKVRGGLNWRRGDLAVNGFVNYISAMRDTGVVPNAPIASWTTADINIAYTFGEGTGAQSGTRIALSAINLFDKDPSYTASPIGYEEPHFDSTNMSVMGRFITLSVSKAW